MFSYEFYFICLAFVGYVLVSRRWAVVEPPARRTRPRPARPPTRRNGGAQPPAAVPRRRTVQRPSAGTFSDEIEILDVKSGPLPAPDPSTATHATPALSGTQPPGLGVFESACPSAPGSSHQPPASSAEPTRRAPVARHPTEEFDAKPPVHAPEQVTIVSPIRWRERKVGTKTFYWEPERLALQIIRTPPDLTGEPKLALGDLFYYQTLTRFQFWIWILDDAGRPHWKAIRYGYQRDDGRRLMITPVERKPAWVTPERWCQYRHELRLLDAYGEV